MSRLLIAGLLAAALAPGIAQGQDQDKKKARVAKLRRMCREITGEVEKLRGLSFKYKVPQGVQSVKELRGYLSSEFDKSVPKARSAKYDIALAKVGLIPKGTDMRKLMFAVLAENIGGFYHPRTRSLYLIDQPILTKNPMMGGLGGGDRAERMAIAHELTHALEDQHFTLLGLNLDKMHNDDWKSAVMSLVEGTATVMMQDWILHKMRPGANSRLVPSGMGFDMMDMALRNTGSKALDAAPNYVKYGLLGTYIRGMTFVNAIIRKRGSWEGVNKAFNDPPASMEQVLHPEKYLDRDQPTFIRLPGFNKIMATAGYERLVKQSLGEMYMGVLIEDHTKSRRTGREAAKGWDGDTYIVYRNPKTGATAMVLMATFDTTKDAAEFANAYEKVIAAKYPAAKGDNRRWTDASGVIHLHTEGKHVYALESVPADLTKRLIKQFDRARLTEHKGGPPKIGYVKRESKPVMLPRPFTYKTPTRWTSKFDAASDYPLTLTGPTGATITVGVLETGMGHAKAGKLIERLLPRKLEGYRKIAYKIGDLGYDAYQIFYTGKKDGEKKPHHFSQLIVPGEGKLYMLMLTTRSDTVEVDNAAFQAFAKSFRVNR